MVDSQSDNKTARSIRPFACLYPDIQGICRWHGSGWYPISDPLFEPRIAPCLPSRPSLDRGRFGPWVSTTSPSPSAGGLGVQYRDPRVHHQHRSRPAGLTYPWTAGPKVRCFSTVAGTSRPGRYRPEKRLPRRLPPLGQAPVACDARQAMAFLSCSTRDTGDTGAMVRFPPAE